MQPIIKEFSTYSKTVFEILDEIGAAKIFAAQSSILIKPNLVNATPHPVTTSSECCEAVIQYIMEKSQAEIVIAEGCGDAVLETHEVFSSLGYDKLSRKYQIDLIDLNHEPLLKLTNDNCQIFREMYLPKIVFDYFIISIPVLKVHSFSDITGSLKNMMGIAPPKYYSGRYGSWKKAVFHERIHQSIVELNQYRTPDLTLMDASIGLSDFHLGGRTCQPFVNKLVAGFSPIAVDRIAASLLGLNWRSIPHLMGEEGNN